jgi:F-box and WD-40 domain protein CDC4
MLTSSESNWLHGGHIQCTRVGNDSGVVTSLALDGELMVVGMTSHKIHIFRAKTGEFVKSLVGHEAGVWCLILISPGGGTPPKWESPENTDEEDESEEDGPARKGEGEFTFSPSPRLPTRRMNPPSAAATRASMNREPGELASYRDEGLTRRASFNGLRIGHLDPPTQYPIGPPGEFMRLPPLGRPAQAPQGSNTPRSARSGLFSGLAGAIPSSSMPSTPRGRESATQEHVLPNFTSGQTPPPTAKPAHRKARRMPQSDVRGSAMGWGQPGAVVVSGSCDRHVRVWDVNTG